MVLGLYGSFSFISIMHASLLPIAALYRIICIAVIVFSAILLIWENRSLRISVWKLLISLSVLVLFGIAALVTDRLYLGAYAAFVLIADRCDFKKIVKVSLIAASGALLLLLLFCAVGILTDYLYYGSGQRVAHCLGFSYYSRFPFILFLCTIMFLFLRKKKTLLLYAAILAVNFVVYYYTTLRLTYYLTYLLVLLDWLLNRKSKWNLSSGKWPAVSACLFPIGLAVTWLAMVFYDPGNRFMSWLNTLLNNRIRLMHKGYLEYSVKLFGNYIAMRGNSALRDTSDYFYIDSGFGYSLLAYGLIFSVAVVFLYSLIIYFACKTNNKSLFIWALIIMIFTLVNNIWLTVTYNPLLMLSVPVLGEIKKQHRQSLRK